MTVFADTSALVKLYADERGSDLVEAAEPLAISQLARVEVPAALWRKHRMGELAADDVRVLLDAFKADYSGTADGPERFARVVVNAEVLEDAARLVGLHGLRAYDAVQLASACAARAAAPGCDTFAAFDKHLREAATREEFAILEC